jgi:DNA-binding NarL/FixJ family response regulator
VFVTARFDAGTRERASAVRGAGYLTKPFAPGDVVEAVAAAAS